MNNKPAAPEPRKGSGPRYTALDIQRAEEALARIGIKRSLRATGVDRNDFIELHVDQLVDLLGVKRPSRKRTMRPDDKQR